MKLATTMPPARTHELRCALPPRLCSASVPHIVAEHQERDDQADPHLAQIDRRQPRAAQARTLRARFHAQSASDRRPRRAAPRTCPGRRPRRACRTVPAGARSCCPFGPMYVTAPRPLTPSVTTRENSAGIQRAGSYTWSTPTMELTPQQTRRIPSSRARCSGVRTNTGAQKSGDITAKYTTMCATPPTSDAVYGFDSISASSAHHRGHPRRTRGARRTVLRLHLPPRERRQADRERGESDRQTERLGAGEVQQRRQRGLADDEQFRKAPPRRARHDFGAGAGGRLYASGDDAVHA